MSDVTETPAGKAAKRESGCDPVAQGVGTGPAVTEFAARAGVAPQPAGRAPEPVDQRARDIVHRGRFPKRWWLAVGAGTAAAVPIGWLLSYAATLPFLLGPFFFVLFGLLIGAIMHRVGAPGRPYARGVLLAGTTVVVIAGWGTSIVMEGRDFPKDMAIVAGNVARSIGDQSIEQYRAVVADEIRGFLREKYPPGGTLGYVHWVVTKGELERGQISGLRGALRPRQARVSWVIRVVLSVVLLGFGIGSQTLALRLAHDPATRAKDRPQGSSAA